MEAFQSPHESVSKYFETFGIRVSDGRGGARKRRGWGILKTNDSGMFAYPPLMTARGFR